MWSAGEGDSEDRRLEVGNDWLPRRRWGTETAFEKIAAQRFLVVVKSGTEQRAARDSLRCVGVVVN
jgi:hypothetical protein